ncbi:nickel-dependent hydrogenase large subunit [Streptomyces sp. NPDC001739]
MATVQNSDAERRELTEVAFDPITRIIGNLDIYTKIDFAAREVVECRSTSSLFRGYSVFMKGKDPRYAHFITSRICGICGDNHATCSLYASRWPTASSRPRSRTGSSTGAKPPSSYSTTRFSRTTWCSSTSASAW